MSIKRTLFAFSALMMLPVVALAQVAPPVSPAPGTANIAVIHLFADGNTEDSVSVTATCTSGSISPSTVTLANGEGHVFVVSGLPDVIGGVDCTVTQTEIGDYEGRYLCAPDLPDLPDNGIPGDDQCADPGPDGGVDDIGNPLDWSSTSCSYSDVTADSVGYCAVASVPEPVDVDVVKVWEEFGAAQADFDTDVTITLTCANALSIVGGTQSGINEWTATVDLGGADYEDDDGDYTGVGTAEFEVIPEWIAEDSDPDEQEFETECWADEDVNNSTVEVDNGCGDEANPGIGVRVGMGDECTITNTVFFEGIPTLSQYGMAIMALLMLGVGFIGMRRFV